MKQYEITFLHTDGDVRKWIIRAYDLERATGGFYVNWGYDMKLIEINKKGL